MSLVSGVTGSKIYTVRVAALVAGIWQAYGMSCNVQTPVPLTQLASGSCNVTIPKMATNLACNAVSGATNYRYEVINTALGYNQVYVKGSNSTLFRINYLSGILFNTTYTVRVAAMVNGLWGAYGPACTVKTPVSLMIQDDGNLENAASKFANEYILDIFPNPSRDRFTFRSEQAGEFVLINELGQKLHVFSLNKENAFQFELSELSPGNYFVLSTNGTEMQAKKLTIIP